jgi:hypothetical protein
MASRQRRARMRAALSTSSAQRQSSTTRPKRPVAFTVIWRACAVLQASLVAFSAAHAETRCIPVGEVDGWEPGSSVAYTFRWPDTIRDGYSETPQAFNYTREDSCGTTSGEVVEPAGPFRVADSLGEYDVMYYNQRVRETRLVNGQCTTDEYTTGFRNLSADGHTDLPPWGFTCVTKLETAGSLAQPLPPSCPSSGAFAGNPILPVTAEKYESELDFEDAGPAPLRFVRTYRSTWGKDPMRGTGTLGKAWAHNHVASLQWTSTTITVASAEGYKRTFTRAAGSNAWTTPDSADSLSESYTLRDRSDTLWTYRRADDDAVLRFDKTGRLLSLTARNGWVTTYMYLGKQLARIDRPLWRGKSESLESCQLAPQPQLSSVVQGRATLMCLSR